MTVERVDAVIIGGNVRGLVAAYVLNALGMRCVLLEPAPAIGGADATFTAADGSRFEFGMHVLDEDRSLLATRLFTHVLAGRFHRVRLRRAIVMRNAVMPYAPEPADMPDELSRMIASGELVDELGDAPPTRQRLGRYYGEGFASLIFDEVLPSFPSEHRHRAFGVDESRLLANIYPWFFPRAVRPHRSTDESRGFHDKLRAGIPQYVLYPHGGFGAFAEALHDALDPERVEVFTGVGRPCIEIEPGMHTIRSVSVGGRTFEAPHYFWAAAWPQLCEILALPCQDTATDCILLGSFRLDHPPLGDYHEILFGDRAHHINRLSFPGRLRESCDPLLQIEFAVPCAESWPDDPAHWRSVWLDSLRRVGVIDDTHRVEHFDFKTRRMHFNSFGMEGTPLRDADPALLMPDSNVHPLVPSMANLNLNSHIPRTIVYVAAVMAGDGSRAMPEALEPC